MIVLILVTILSIAFLGILGYGITMSIKNITAMEKEQMEREARKLDREMHGRNEML